MRYQTRMQSHQNIYSTCIKTHPAIFETKSQNDMIKMRGENNSSRHFPLMLKPLKVICRGLELRQSHDTVMASKISKTEIYQFPPRSKLLQPNTYTPKMLQRDCQVQNTTSICGSRNAQPMFINKSKQIFTNFSCTRPGDYGFGCSISGAKVPEDERSVYQKLNKNS